MLLTRTIPFNVTRSPALHEAAMDVVRTEDALLVSIDLPGVHADSIDLQAQGNVLTVRAQRPARHEQGRVLVAERPTGTVTRRLRLGQNLDADNISADYTDGVLSLRVPVADQARPRKVLIDQGGAA
ncbi:heat-shock protein Hsp20 [Nocardiopsis sp. TSRI0078]|uniref:Hsp20/alpha crystallin family protein n=1 Tax=unclassified Nocardiopsis TaxID=2649073 RepID=UPI000938A58D|nr:Hsp20/alpha crystallin family protein [Nocardiopsis sp. TSRI0078]OKI22847.1 heat-shock protein Hsp20 [Nocardiopsis sp. TSRI0078]